MLPSSDPDPGLPEDHLRIGRNDTPNPVDVDRRREARNAEERSALIRDLRSRWNAPRRHVLRNPPRAGPWGDTLATLEARLGTGVLVALVGPRGTGKTQMAVELMKAVTAGGQSALYRTTAEFLMLLKGTYRGDPGRTELDVFKAHRKPSLLVLDEFTRRLETEWENQVLFELLNHRYADMTDTVLTGNLARTDFEAHLGLSLLSRLQEGGGIVECLWPTFRE